MKTTLLISVRNIIKSRVNSVIIIGGLAVAFACVLLIYLYVSQELSYNNFHANKNRIFRIHITGNFTDGTEHSAVYLDPELSKIIKENVPQIKRSTAFRIAHNPTMTFENRNFEENVCITEPDFFDMFSFNLIAGNKKEIFKDPSAIVITNGLANKLMAVCNCTRNQLLGKTITFMNIKDLSFSITGIMDNPPKNSSIQFSALIPYKYEKSFNKSDSWFGNSSIFYEINANASTNEAKAQITSTVKKYYKDLIKGLQDDKIIAGDNSFSINSVSIRNTHLNNVDSDYEQGNSKTTLYILSVIGFLILIIASSNFIMLSLGQSLNKTGDVGLRKAIGARNVNIFNLFFTENAVITITAIMLGIFLFITFLPVFNQLAKNGIYTELINIPQVVVFLIFISLSVITISSLVPLSSLRKVQPSMLTSKKWSMGNKNGLIQIFVTVQYTLSIGLIILTLFVVRQTYYLKNKDLGFSSKNILNLRIYHLETNEKLALRDALQSYPGIETLTLTDRDYVSGRSNNTIKSDQSNYTTRILNVDHNYIPTLGLKITSGNNFEENTGDQSIIINEKLQALLGLKGDVVGHSIQMDGKDYFITGVVKDYHFDSMKEEIEPLMLIPKTEKGNKSKYIFIKYNQAQLAQLLPFIRNKWKEIIPDKAFDLKFWDEQLNNRYQSEVIWSKIVAYASIIAVILSSLGLFSLTILIINKRTKEVGIRKVNGAQISEVMIMLNQYFIKWVVIAFVIACPLAWYTMHKWLENFAYKTSLSWWIFAIAGATALFIALLTVSWQSWRAATRNPVESLRYE